MVCQYPTPKSTSSASKIDTFGQEKDTNSAHLDPEFTPDQECASADSQSRPGPAGAQIREESVHNDATPTQIQVMHGQGVMYDNADELCWTNDGMDDVYLFLHDSYNGFSPATTEHYPFIPQKPTQNGGGIAPFLSPELNETVISPQGAMKEDMCNGDPNCDMSPTMARKDCECNSAILGRLEHILEWVEHKYLLETLVAIRDNVEHFKGLSQCSFCLKSSRSMLLLVMFAEKPVDQLRDLIPSTKRLSTNDNTASIRFADYVTRSSQECSVMYFALLRLHTRNLRTTLAGLLHKAMKWGWTGQVLTLKALTAHVEGVYQHIDS